MWIIQHQVRPTWRLSKWIFNFNHPPDNRRCDDDLNYWKLIAPVSEVSTQNMKKMNSISRALHTPHGLRCHVYRRIWGWYPSRRHLLYATLTEPVLWSFSSFLFVYFGFSSPTAAKCPINYGKFLPLNVDGWLAQSHIFIDSWSLRKNALHLSLVYNFSVVETTTDRMWNSWKIIILIDNDLRLFTDDLVAAAAKCFNFHVGKCTRMEVSGKFTIEKLHSDRFRLHFSVYFIFFQLVFELF